MRERSTAAFERSITSFSTSELELRAAATALDSETSMCGGRKTISALFGLMWMTGAGLLSSSPWQHVQFICPSGLFAWCLSQVGRGDAVSISSGIWQEESVELSFVIISLYSFIGTGISIGIGNGIGIGIGNGIMSVFGGNRPGGGVGGNIPGRRGSGGSRFPAAPRAAMYGGNGIGRGDASAAADGGLAPG